MERPAPAPPQPEKTDERHTDELISRVFLNRNTLYCLRCRKVVAVSNRPLKNVMCMHCTDKDVDAWDVIRRCSACGDYHVRGKTGTRGSLCAVCDAAKV